MASWPVGVVGSDGCRLALGEALGPGGRKVESLLDTLLAGEDSASVDAEGLASQTPIGTLGLPVCLLGLAEAVEAAAGVDPAWLAAVEQRRSTPRRALLDAGRHHQLEAALHMAMLLGAEQLDPDDDADVDAHVASGAMLWILGAAVAWALVPDTPSPFTPWAALVAHRLWPVGPSGGKLVLSALR